MLKFLTDKPVSLENLPGCTWNIMESDRESVFSIVGQQPQFARMLTLWMLFYKLPCPLLISPCEDHAVRLQAYSGVAYVPAR